MRILSVTNTPLDPSLGSGKTVLSYTEGLRRLGHQVDVLEPGDFESLAGLTRAQKFRLAWGSWRAIAQRLRRVEYDLIEFYGDEFWMTALQLSREPSRPLLVAHTNGLELLAAEREAAFAPPTTAWRRLRRTFFDQTHARLSNLFFSRTDAFVGLCELDRDHVVERGFYPPEHAAVVRPGLDPEYLALPFREAREERVAYTGSWIPRKGVGKLAAVMTRVLERHPRLVFDVFGTGGRRDAVLAAFPPHLHGRIEVHPKLPEAEIAAGLARAKVFFFPSQYEGFGIAVGEAMAAGCAVVSTPTGFAADLAHGQDALITGFEDVAGMEAALDRLLENEALRVEISRRGWETARILAWQPNVEHLEALYRRWVAEGVRRPASSGPPRGERVLASSR